jgi:hypothetical protein
MNSARSGMADRAMRVPPGWMHPVIAKLIRSATRRRDHKRTSLCTR